jgi:Branched-chain amino acid aminotransferase/4-amino-4-deoxychorismate lyase
MSKGKFILVNGSFVSLSDYRITLEEAAALNFSEQFRVMRSNFPFFDETLEIIKLKLFLLNQAFPDFIDDDGADLKRQMERTLTKNKHFLGAILTLTFRFLNGQTKFEIQSESTPSAIYDLNDKGLYAEIFDKIQKPVSSLSTLTLGSVAYWQISQEYCSASTADEFIIVNTQDSILEIPYGNLYLIKGDSVLGASPDDGAYVDVTKSALLDIFGKLNLKFSEHVPITPEAVENADEVFCVNAIQGIRWIIGISGKRYFNATTRKINELFSKLAIS